MDRGNKKPSALGYYIIEYANAHPDLTIYELAENLKVTPRTVYNYVEPRGKTVKKNSIKDKVLEYLEKNPDKSTTEISKALGVSYNTVKKYRNEK